MVSAARRHAALAGIALILCLQGGPATAADSSGSWAIHGLGSASCKALNDNKAFREASPQRAQLMAWLQGYLTAGNRLLPETFDQSPLVSGEALTSILVNNCALNPTANVQAAADGVLQLLAPTKISYNSPLLEIRNEYGQVTVRAQTLQAMQAALTQAKLYKGYVDGKDSPALQAAIRSFQAGQKLPETGLADPDTIIRLLALPQLTGKSAPQPPKR